MISHRFFFFFFVGKPVNCCVDQCYDLEVIFLHCLCVDFLLLPPQAENAERRFYGNNIFFSFFHYEDIIIVACESVSRHKLIDCSARGEKFIITYGVTNKILFEIFFFFFNTIEQLLQLYCYLTKRNYYLLQLSSII